MKLWIDGGEISSKRYIKWKFFLNLYMMQNWNSKGNFDVLDIAKSVTPLNVFVIYRQLKNIVSNIDIWKIRILGQLKKHKTG